MQRSALAPIMGVLLWCGVPVSNAEMYRLIDLGTYGSGSSYAYSVNDAGQVVGTAGQRAVLFDTTGGGNNLYLPSTADNPHGVARSVNNSGEIVGQYAHQAACVFDPTGGGAIINLGPSGSFAYDISNTGQIVGSIVASGYSRAARFDVTSDPIGIVDLGALPGYNQSYARSINDSGQIVGYALPPTGGLARPVLFDPSGSGSNVDLGTLGGTSGSARSINNLGQIVGIAVTGSGDSHAVLFDATGSSGNIDLGGLGGVTSAANAINDLGFIVGQAQDLTGAVRACLFDATGAGNNIDLNTLIDLTSGWTLQAALDINNSGWIVGQGIAPGALPGTERAFLLIPEAEPVPLPGAVLLGMVGMGTATWRLRRMRA